MDTSAAIRMLMRLVEDEAAKHEGRHVMSLHVRVGELSGVDPTELSSGYAEAVHGTSLEGTTLTVETVVPNAVCKQCGNSFRFDQSHTQCNKCGSMRLELSGGNELYLDSVLTE